MKKLISILILTSATAATYLPAAENYIAKYISEPVPVYLGGFNSRELLYMVGQEQGEVIFRYDPRKPQEVFIPINSKDLRLSCVFPENFKIAKSLVDDEKYDEAVTLLRPIAYPIHQYLNIPSSQFNGFIAIELLFHALSKSQHIDEAMALAQEIPINELSPELPQLSLSFANRLVDEGRNSDALIILRKLPLSEDDQKHFSDVMKFANILRETGQVQNDKDLILDAMKLYARIHQVPGTKFVDMASLWIAYCNIHLDKIESARIFIENAKDITIQSKAYSLKRLIDAKIALMENDFLLAVERVSKGVVYSDFSDSWAPEILYVTAYCYENLGNLKTAAEIYGEVILLYPESEWAKKSEARLAEIPEEERGLTGDEEGTEDSEISEEEGQVDRIFGEGEETDELPEGEKDN